MKTKIKLVRCGVNGQAFSQACTQAEKILAIQIHKDTRQYVPALTGVFDRNSRVYGNVIEYVGDQVDFLWRGVRMVNSQTGKGPRKIPGVGWRWPKGATLVPTSAPLHYTTDIHPKAGPAWMDRSERDNATKWQHVAEELIANGYDKY